MAANPLQVVKVICLYVRPMCYVSSTCMLLTLSLPGVIRILFGYNAKFSGLANKEMYGLQLGELAYRSWE